ncbi:MAG: alpha/beta hydrolase fold-domain-containing protein [Lentinula lateritia]|uniref:Alpha/beta hydrolase fold-domain-containing protein n=1 Tax=Lentinula lateritia TaxID=40482 RepID=A0ABQ8VLT0_9AGAR|nr:MAG: alpha/beta hydrolase fold-domain-containing protein [Lentinula lateritia]KAJ4496856.1 alpha/beta hydrolase fold-domain-containing protein [Lentinula lateritia]
MSATERVPKQPLHPTIISRLDPEYVKFHEEVLQYITPPHTLSWDPALRNAPAVPGSTEPLKVHKTQDFNLTHTDMRAFIPEGEAPSAGWPVFIFFHGGGWTFGTIGSEATFATNMSVRAKCIVISVNYRLAPEHKYPIAVEDAVESLQWVLRNGKTELNIDTAKIAVGGSSSGGNLAAILALKAAEPSFTPPLPSPLVFQLLVVPVTDNTATDSPGGLWEENKHTPWLSPARMNWFKDNYLPNKEDWTKWTASPIFAPAELLAKTPNAWIGLGELDILKGEGVKYGEKLKEVGVKEVEIVIYKGGPHPIMAMDGAAVKLGAKLITDAATALNKAFNAA